MGGIPIQRLNIFKKGEIMSKTNKVSDVYYGGEVATYDQARQGEKWEKEEKSFLELLGLIAPSEIIDCPIGTGRWLSSYQNKFDLDNVTILGLDISQDMQDEAKRRAVRLNIALQTQFFDLTSDDPPQCESSQGLFVSTRFLNWVHPEDLPAVVGAFANSKSRWVICSLRYPSGSSIFESVKRLWCKYGRRKRTTFIHDLENFIQLIAKYSYCVVHEELVEQSVATRFSYFLLEKKITGVCSEDTDGGHS